MKTVYALLAATAMATAMPATAQTIDSTSGSNSNANSGSQSGAASNQTQGQQANNAGIGNSTSTSNSGSASDSNSTSGSQSASDQGQVQTQGQTATNSQGVSVATTFNSTNRKVTEVRTNAAVPLAASSSFSSDFCGSTASGGVSAAPLGISLGTAAPVYDDVCRSLRRAEKFGMIAANYSNMGQPEMAMKAMSMMVWEVCTASGNGKQQTKETAVACEHMGLMGGDNDTPVAAPAVAAPAAPAAPTPAYQAQPVIQDIPATRKSDDDNKYGKLGELGAADHPDATAVAAKF